MRQPFRAWKSSSFGQSQSNLAARLQRRAPSRGRALPSSIVGQARRVGHGGKRVARPSPMLMEGGVQARSAFF